MIVSKRNGLSDLGRTPVRTVRTRAAAETSGPEPGGTSPPSFLDRIVANFKDSINIDVVQPSVTRSGTYDLPKQGSPTTQAVYGGAARHQPAASDIPRYQEGDPPEMSPGVFPDLSLDEAADAAANAEAAETQQEEPETGGIPKYLIYGGVAIAGLLVYRMMVKK